MPRSFHYFNCEILISNTKINPYRMFHDIWFGFFRRFYRWHNSWYIDSRMFFHLFRNTGHTLWYKCHYTFLYVYNYITMKNNSTGRCNKNAVKMGFKCILFILYDGHYVFLCDKKHYWWLGQKTTVYYVR